MKNRAALIVLGVIFVFGFAVRVYKLDKIPPSLNWDEVASAYNAYTISHWGRDEWGKWFPLVFTSFRDDKHPVHIYLTAPFVGIFGPTDFNARFPSALISSLGIIVIYFLAKEIFKSKITGILSAFFLSVSPYHIHFSRGLWELNFALFFFLLGLLMFFLGLKKSKYLYFSFFGFGLSLYSYHSSKVVVFPIVLLLIILYLKELARKKKHFYLSLIVFLVFVLGMLLQPRLLGLARVKQTSFSETLLKDTLVYKKYGNLKIAPVEVAIRNYPQYFSSEYLFLKGDQNPRNSVKVIGQFYKVDIMFIVLGVTSLFFCPFRIILLLLFWLMLAPFPSAISSNAPNAARAIFMLGFWQLVAGLGASTAVKLAKVKYLKALVIAVIVLLVGREFVYFYSYYLREYPKKEAIEWQYGMKDVVLFANEHVDYEKVYVDSIRQQPYIFFLFYGKVPLPEFLKTVQYQEGPTKSYNTVYSFGKYQFGNWDWVNSHPAYKVLYALEPYKYSGLVNINHFEVVKLVKYPNESDAFYLVSGYW